MTRLLCLLSLLLLPFCTFAQQHRILDSNIKTLQVVANGDWLSPPVMSLHGRQHVVVEFDDLSHVYRRLAYKIEHCEADWTPSTQLFESDYIEGFHSGNIIEDVTESFNTNTLYTHYRFRIPNSSLRLKMSGNYRITIYDDNDEERPVAIACFMVVEPLMGIQLDITSNTDVDINNAHQQVAMQISYGPMKVNFPKEQIHTVITQNQQWNDARLDAPWQYVRNDGLRWEHCRNYIFNAGNEYRKFEILDVDRTALNVDRMEWDGEDYIAHLETDRQRRNYVYDEDANGAFLIRNTDNVENERTCEYILVCFQLAADKPYDGKIFVDGIWATESNGTSYKMLYDETKRCYHLTLRLKQGYYSYQYKWKKPDGTIAPVPSEGNFYQTENTYQAYVYYKEPGGRTDKLVGYTQVSY